VTLNKVITLFYWFTLSITLPIAITLVAPETEYLLLLQYIILFLPRYWHILLCVLLIAFFKKLTKTQRYSLPFLLLVSLFYLDIQVNFNQNHSNENHEIELTLVTANLGEGAEIANIKALVKYYDPDIFLFQEAGHLTNLEFFSSYPFKDCKGNLCFISKYEFANKVSLENSVFNGYGHWAAFYEVEFHGTLINLANVHLPSVRRAFNNLSNVNVIHENRTIATSIINEWASSKESVVIAGDFNTSIIDPLYRQNFSMYKNAISAKGHGFNNTIDYKYRGFSVSGIRVDHILLSQQFSIKKAVVLETTGGDHYPILSKVSLNNLNSDEKY
jgi:endonuclease/exonuclease/phosphatase (EEP) superfamily protein YafD